MLPNTYLIIFASENDNLGEELHANFKLSKEGETLSLYNHLGVLQDRYDSVLMKTDVSYGRPSQQAQQLAYFDQPSPGSANNTTAYPSLLEPPQLSHQSGFYADHLQVTLSHNESGVTFRYTLDGSEPSQYSPVYGSTMTFVNRENDDNVVSEIPTNPGFDYPFPGYDEDRANTRGWLPPVEKVNKTNVLKVKAFKTGYLESESVAATYFINPETSNRYNLPVISLTAEMSDFFSDETGIYVYGTSGAEGNYNEHGREWERLTFMQYFENDGSLAFEQQLGVRIHGGGGRHSTIKNMRMYARDEYGKSSLKYKFFSNSGIKEFKRFMVRGPGHRPDCAPRDDLADLLIQNLDMDVQHIQPVIVFLNGEYWGIHTIKERFDQKYLELKYGKKDDDYVIMRNRGTLDSGEEGDDQPYIDLLDFVATSDMSQMENYEYVKTQLDIDNYLNYFTSEVFMGNVDWVNTNIKFWRYKGFDKSTSGLNGLDGKWRWFMFDFDLVFGGSCKDITPTVNVLRNAFDPDYEEGSLLARRLKENNQFVYDFVNRMCDRMNSTFSENNFLLRLSEIDQMLSPHMLEHVKKWRYPSVSETLAGREMEVPSLEQWNFILEGLQVYPAERKRKIIDHMQEQFLLSDTIHMKLDVNNLSMGNIQVNSLFINEFTDGVTADVFPWHGTYFQNIPFTVIAVPKLGFRFVEWEETGETLDTLTLDLDFGMNLTAVFEEDPDFVFTDALYINEFMASNQSTITDEFDAHADWIEIFNPNSTPIDISGFYISDDKLNPYKYQFDRGSHSTIIPPYGYQLIWCDDRSERGIFHANFKLDSSGEDIVLTAPDSSVIDELSYGEQYTDVSFGRDQDGSFSWKFFQKPIGPTPGATNNNASIHELTNNHLLIYPNPVKRGKKVYFNQYSDVKLYNLLGELLFEEKHTTSLNTQSLNKGVYMVKLNENSNTKLIVD
jgi:hypothetical protein